MDGRLFLSSYLFASSSFFFSYAYSKGLSFFSPVELAAGASAFRADNYALSGLFTLGTNVLPNGEGFDWTLFSVAVTCFLRKGLSTAEFEVSAC